jgi:hypothetical protein
MSKYKVLEEGVLLDDWMDDNPEQPYIPKKTPSCNCNTCPDEDGHLLKDNFLGEFLTEADKRRARENLGLKDMEGDAANITYKTDTDPEIESVKDALDKLFYVPITISSFTVSPNEAETGSEVNTLTYNWKYNKEIKQQYFDGEEINASLRTKTITGAFRTTISKTLTASDGTESKSSTASLVFKDGRYYGASATDPTVSDLISSFTRSLNLTRGNSFTVNAREGQYIYLLVPYSLKDISFSVGGFEGGFFIVDDNYQFTRYEGVTLRCVLFRSDNPGLGSTTVTIK